MPLSLSEFDAVTFDVYGTLIDWEPSIVAFLREWAGRHRVSSSEQDLLMAFDGARAMIQQERPAHLYPEVLRRCLDRISSDFGVVASGEEREAFALMPHHWPAYPDSHAETRLPLRPCCDGRERWRIQTGLAALPNRYLRPGRTGSPSRAHPSRGAKPASRYHARQPAWP